MTTIAAAPHPLTDLLLASQSYTRLSEDARRVACVIEQCGEPCRSTSSDIAWSIDIRSVARLIGRPKTPRTRASEILELLDEIARYAPLSWTMIGGRGNVRARVHVVLRIDRRRRPAA